MIQETHGSKEGSEDWGVYCKTCGGCGEVGCDGILDFLKDHVTGKTDCKYEEVFIDDIKETYDLVDELYERLTTITNQLHDEQQKNNSRNNKDAGGSNGNARSTTESNDSGNR
jgi:benzoyl-CoA reductase/2-hydroxyglutaryl-CoA dehydratase subunit BcrC/BadD/HgdB